MINPNGSIPGYEGAGGFGGAGVLTGVLGAAGQFYDTYQSNKTARENTDKTIAAQRREAELAYQRSIQMWHMQNAYNSPAEQMKRFGAAGLNPHLIYGQGSSGNASGTPQYQAPNLQYRYEAPAYGGAVGSILPTLMSVGTWMQNMRASEVEIQSKETGMDKTRQLIDYLYERNPRLIQELDQRLSLFPWQRSVAQSQAGQGVLKLEELEKELSYKFGAPPDDSRLPYGGTKALDYYRRLAEMKLKQAQASWTDYNITNPQGLMQLVLSGVMGMAGQQLRFSSGGRINPKAKRVKTFYQNGKRRSQVVDY